MKKIFSFFAAMLVAVAVNAGEVSVNPGNDALIAALQSASADDVLILADGTYNEYSNYIDFNKNIEVKAAEGAKPVINVGCYIKVQGNATVKIQGIKFDGTEQGHNGSSYNHFMRVYSVNSLELEGCEFSNTKGNKVIEVEAANHLGVLKINNCYFHDGNYSAIHVAQGSDAHACDKIIITNSTFANFGGFNEGMIEIYSKNGALAASTDEDVEINVDHCTFYNISKTDEGSTYGVLDIRKSANAVVSNCIFANPATLAEGAYANRATQMYGGAITNCLLFNTPNHRTDAVTPANPLKDVDPLFVDAANGNFALGEGSPALGAGTDGSNLGDPRWNAADEPALADGYYLAGIFNGVDKWSVNELSADVKFIENNTSEARSGEMVLRNVLLTAGDQFKVALVENGNIPSDDSHWFGSGEGNANFIVTEAYAGQKDIYFVPVWQNDWNGYIWVADASTTAVKHAAAEVKAVKMMENGQLVIIKNGVKYNALGAELR